MKTTELKIDLRSKQAANLPLYSIFIGAGLTSNLSKFLKNFPDIHRFVIITDKSVEKICGKKIQQNLKKSGFNVDLISFPAGEHSKNEKTKMMLDHSMLKRKCGRDTMILALGGGVVGDMAGYVAATYMRGIPFIQIPTTFLGMVDSSIGGKVGIDTPYGKNLLGAFWHPKAVISDLELLKELPEMQRVNGLIEALKIFLTYDQQSFSLFEKNWQKLVKGDLKLLQPVVSRAVELKIGVVQRDEFDANERMVVNFGHTIGHSLEYLSGYKLLHGFGVALGILVESKISQLMGILSENDLMRIEQILANLGIKKDMLKKYKVADVLRVMQIDKKNVAGKTKFVLLKGIGEVYVNKGQFGHLVEQKIVKLALEYFNQNITN